MLLRIDRFRNLFRFFHYFGRELEREMILPNDRKHVDPGIRRTPEQLDDFAFRIHMA